MPIPASTSHATLLYSHWWYPYDLASEATVKQGGQSNHTVRCEISNMTEIELSITKVTGHPHPILNKARLPPLILARQPVSQQWTSAIHVIYTAPNPAIVTDELTPQNNGLL
jgi:hypothetical protein